MVMFFWSRQDYLYILTFRSVIACPEHSRLKLGYLLLISPTIQQLVRIILTGLLVHPESSIEGSQQIHGINSYTCFNLFPINNEIYLNLISFHVCQVVDGTSCIFYILVLWERIAARLHGICLTTGSYASRAVYILIDWCVCIDYHLNSPFFSIVCFSLLLLQNFLVSGLTFYMTISFFSYITYKLTYDTKLCTPC